MELPYLMHYNSAKIESFCCIFCSFNWRNLTIDNEVMASPLPELVLTPSDIPDANLKEPFQAHTIPKGTID